MAKIQFFRGLPEYNPVSIVSDASKGIAIRYGEYIKVTYAPADFASLTYRWKGDWLGADTHITTIELAVGMTPQRVFTVSGIDFTAGSLGSDLFNSSDLLNRQSWTVIGSEQGDIFSAGDYKDIYDLRGGDDTAWGLGGNDVMDGGAGSDTLDGSLGRDRLTGGTGNDTLYGGDGADDLNGGQGNDILDGGDGSDTITGGVGKDELTGGKGADRFDFNLRTESVRGANSDTIADFQTRIDKIDLSTIDARDDTAGDQAFTWLGAQAFTGVDGQLRYAKGLLQGDINGDTIADFVVKVTGTVALGDLIL